MLPFFKPFSDMIVGIFCCSLEENLTWCHSFHHDLIDIGQGDGVDHNSIQYDTFPNAYRPLGLFRATQSLQQPWDDQSPFRKAEMSASVDDNSRYESLPLIEVTTG
jgi:hypothetical protein